MFFAIPGSERGVVKDSVATPLSDTTKRIRLSVYLRHNPLGDRPNVEEMGLLFPKERRHLSADEYVRTFGASKDDLEAVRIFAKANGLDVKESNIPRLLWVEGTLNALSKAFGDVKLLDYQIRDASFRGRTGPISVPEKLKGIVDAVFGFDNRRVGKPYFVMKAAVSNAIERVRTPNTYYPTDVAALYDFPDALGHNQAIAILAFNDVMGGFDINALNLYFTKILQMDSSPIIETVSVNRRPNNPSSGIGHISPLDHTQEIMLDIQVAGAAAPGAKLIIYFADMTEQGWVDAINTIVADKVNDPSVISISYGHPEDQGGLGWTDMGKRQMNLAFKAAAARGITVCCASGNDGSRDGVVDNKPHVDYPASDPFALSCGGTRLESANDSITDERVWNSQGHASGGGVSTFFPLPDWQKMAGITTSVNTVNPTGRGVPDVSSVADNNTPIVVITINKSQVPTGGTSMSAPMWAALIARINDELQTRVGYLNPILYTRFSQGVLRDIKSGNNGDFSAKNGWDACTGLGSPGGKNLLQALKPNHTN